MRYSWALAYEVAAFIRMQLHPGCERIEIAGSLRRRKPDVGDIEILYIPIMQEEPDPADMFATRNVVLADGRILGMEKAGILARRKNSLGREMYGPLNKLLVHVASGIPVDLFAATAENWFNYLVCRTGPADSNTRICMAAQRLGWKWNPYGVGFTSAGGEVRRMDSERAVFAFVDLPYHEAEGRC